MSNINLIKDYSKVKLSSSYETSNEYFIREIEDGLEAMNDLMCSIKIERDNIMRRMEMLKRVIAL